MRRTLFVGDVHGCSEELDALVSAAGFGGDDRLVLVGDLVAKGPDSAGVVRRARELGALAVLGNHDAAVLAPRPGSHHEQVRATLSPADLRWLELLPLWLDFPELNALVVHAGVLPGVALEHQQRHVLLNLRSIDAAGKASTRADGGVPWATRWPGPRHLIFGHDALRGLQREVHATGLDTGCVYGKALTGVWLPEFRFVSVPARRAYLSVERKE